MATRHAKAAFVCAVGVALAQGCGGQTDSGSPGSGAAGGGGGQGGAGYGGGGGQGGAGNGANGGKGGGTDGDHDIPPCDPKACPAPPNQAFSACCTMWHTCGIKASPEALCNDEGIDGGKAGAGGPG